MRDPSIICPLDDTRRTSFGSVNVWISARDRAVSYILREVVLKPVYGEGVVRDGSGMMVYGDEELKDLRGSLGRKSVVPRVRAPPVRGDMDTWGVGWEEVVEGGGRRVGKRLDSETAGTGLDSTVRFPL